MGYAAAFGLLTRRAMYIIGAKYCNILRVSLKSQPWLLHFVHLGRNIWQSSNISRINEWLGLVIYSAQCSGQSPASLAADFEVSFYK